jgi:hypothetical protein
MHSVRAVFSLRRLRHEGLWRSFYVLVLGIGHVLFKGDIRKQLFSYSMGGARYNLTHQSKPKNKK